MATGRKEEVVHEHTRLKKKKCSDSRVVQCHLCSILNVITLWLKGNHRLKRDADETFADGHSATDRLHDEVLHPRASSDGDDDDEKGILQCIFFLLLFILAEVHASFMMYT